MIHDYACTFWVTVLGQSKIVNFAIGTLDEKNFCSIQVHTIGGTRAKGETLIQIFSWGVKERNIQHMVFHLILSQSTSLSTNNCSNRDARDVQSSGRLHASFSQSFNTHKVFQLRFYNSVRNWFICGL